MILDVSSNLMILCENKLQEAGGGFKADAPVLAGETIPCFDQVVEMKEISPTVANGEPQPGLESQGRAASMPRLAAETQVREGHVAVGD